MPRRKPTSTKQKKADQQLKRAVKRGDVPPPTPAQVAHNRRKRLAGNRLAAPPTTATGIHAKRLESSFVKLPAEWLEHAKELASTQVVERPIPQANRVLVPYDVEKQHLDSSDSLPKLTCPKRPKWRYDQSKKEVEKNEEGLFEKWLQETDNAVEHWRVDGIPAPTEESDLSIDVLKRSPTYFERNLEVWRQL